MPAGDFRSLLRHMEWADALTWKVALKLASAQQDPRLLERLHHLHTVQQVYLQVWRGAAMQVRELSAFPDLSSLARGARPFSRELREFEQALAPGGLGREVVFPWAAQVAERLGSAGPAPLGESLLQVALHSSYHRGQIATRLRELGGEPPLTDFIAWVWKQRPDPEWL